MSGGFGVQGSQKSLHDRMPSHEYVFEDLSRSMVAPEGRREQLTAGGRLFLRLPDSTATWEGPQERKGCPCPVMAASLSQSCLKPRAVGAGSTPSQAGQQTAAQVPPIGNGKGRPGHRFSVPTTASCRGEGDGPAGEWQEQQQGVRGHYRVESRELLAHRQAIGSRDFVSSPPYQRSEPAVPVAFFWEGQAGA